jgi:Fic family protein
MSHQITKFKSGSYITKNQYKSFNPEKINYEWLADSAKLQTLLSEANRYIGELNMFSNRIPNIDIFISLHRAMEASQSSRIEGTRTNIEEAFLEENEVDSEKKNDWKEVQNYIQAMNTSLKELDELPLSNRLIKRIHKILLNSVRGEKKTPGEFRVSQNWIGGSTIKDAIFVPPHHSEISDLMSDLEKFIHNDKIYVPHLIKIGIIHYQFETIHPFLDGNGRIGRLLITLYLVDSGLLKKPILYLSDFFERNKSLYYDNLMRVRDLNDLEQWLLFFLTGIIETSKKSIETFDKILTLKQEIEAKIMQGGKQVEKLSIIMEYLYSRPILNAKTIQEITQVTTPTVYSLIRTLQEIGVLQEMTGQKRNRLFQFSEYLNLFRHKS